MVSSLRAMGFLGEEKRVVVRWRTKLRLSGVGWPMRSLRACFTLRVALWAAERDDSSSYDGKGVALHRLPDRSVFNAVRACREDLLADCFEQVNSYVVASFRPAVEPDVSHFPSALGVRYSASVICTLGAQRPFTKEHHDGREEGS